MTIETKAARSGAAKYLGVAAGAALLVGAASGAQAAPYASGSLSFTNLALSGLETGTVTGATVTGTNFSNYPGAAPGSSAASGSLTAGVDPAAAASGGTAAGIGENVFTQQLTAGSGTRADAAITGALATGATANLAAEGRLTTVPGVAGSSTGTSTGFSISFTTTGSTLALSFNAASNLAAITTGNGEGASAEVNASFTITQGGTAIASFAPGSLNFSVSSTNGTGDSFFSTPSTAYSTGPYTLAAGTYQIQLLAGAQERLDTSTTPTPPVPEPASMALLGVGLLGLGLVRRRKSV